MAKGPLLAILLTSALAGALAAVQPPSIAPAPSGPDCQSLVLDELSSCLTYVENGSKESKPNKECCSGFSTLTRTQPVCLCEILSNSSLTDGFSVNRSRELALPAACGVRTPPLSSCSALGVPAAAPPSRGSGGSPLSSPGSAPAPEPSDGSSNCESLAYENLVPCLDYVSEGSNLTTPDKGCCSGFYSVINAQPICLCELVAKNSSLASGLQINRTKALTLPNICNVTAPPVSLCSAAGYQTGLAPAPSVGDKCTSRIVPKLVPCINYVQKGGNATKPSSQCCSAYSSLVDTEPDCLCDLLAEPNATIPGFAFDRSKAFMLPKACGANKLPTCSGAPSPGSDVGSNCESLAFSNLVPCLDYVTERSNVTKPTKECCSGFSTIITTQPICLCQLAAKNSSLANDLHMNRTKALSLPDVCNVTSPSASLCSAVGYQVGDPGMAPAPPVGDNCTGVVVPKLFPCINYVEKGSNATKPDASCCSGFSSLLDTDSYCLCELLTHPNSTVPGFAFDISRALTLPNACNSGRKLPTCSGAPSRDSDVSNAPPQSNEGIRRSFRGPFNALLAVSLLLSAFF